MTVTLLPDSAYRLRRIYLQAAAGIDTSFVESGRWGLRGDRVALTSGPETQWLGVRGPDRLRLLDRDGSEIASGANHDLARTTRLDPVQDTIAVEKIRWKLFSIDEREVSQDPHREAWIRLEDGRLTGSTGCNSMFGGYTAAASDLRFTQIGATKTGCAGFGDQEPRFLEALEAARTWTIRDGRLELHDPSGRMLARFSPMNDER